MKQKILSQCTSWKLINSVIVFLFSLSLYAGEPVKNLSSYFTNTHDNQTLHAWGPYSKRYAGISHVADIRSGVRFDFSVIPGVYRYKQIIPNVLEESSYFPWDVNPEMTRITYRYELEWKDRVYADVTYHLIDSARVLVEIKGVNNSSMVQHLTLNNMAYMDFADDYPEVTAIHAEKLHWTDATDYTSAEPAKKFPQYNLIPDGWMRFESRSSHSMDGSLLAKGFGQNKGDKVVYNVFIPKGEEQGSLAFRYHVPKGKKARFTAEGFIQKTLDFEGTDGFEILRIPYQTYSGNHTLTLISEGESACELDGFYTGKSEDMAKLEFVSRPRPFTPVMEKSEVEKNFLLKYPDCNNYYGVSWNYPNSEIREVLNNELDVFFRRQTHNRVSKRLVGNSKGHYANACFRPVVVQPNSEQIIYLLICTGSKAEVAAAVADFHHAPEKLIATANQQPNNTPRILPGGEKYRFGCRIKQACLLTNCVYPLYTQREYIRHFGGGKNWNSLYCMDSGFNSLALVEIDTTKAFEHIRLYTTEPGAQSMYIQHGTPLPIEFFAWHDLWNETQSKSMLQFLYPRLKQYAEFMTGKNPTSPTRMKGSNLLKSWDIFYNSGGWDDYPAQMAVHSKNLTKTVTPSVTTAANLMALKTLRMAALELGLKKDVSQYDTEIKIFSEALLKYAWDDESKYFSYVEHDADGNATGILRYEDGSNYNKGLDGISPLMCGITTPEQTEALIGHLFNPKEIWSDIGLSTVDQSAPYYKIDGYWNGSVWMPHQWIMWKSLLDLGKGDLARKIAINALDLWEKECEETYCSFEHFIIASGRGAGWHHFSGISSPVINWLASYYRIGKVTTGFEIWLTDDTFNADYSNYQATLRFDDTVRPHERCMLVCLNPDNDYTVTFNGKAIQTKVIEPGLIQITLPATNKQGKLSVTQESIHL
jgi:hypothetical protein